MNLINDLDNNPINSEALIPIYIERLIMSVINVLVLGSFGSLILCRNRKLLDFEALTTIFLYLTCIILVFVMDFYDLIND